MSLCRFAFKRGYVHCVILCVWLCLLCLASISCKQGKENEWISLFNGRDLSGWRAKIAGHDLDVNYKNTFRVEDGMLITRYDEYESFDGEYGHIFYKNPFSHYKLRVEYRIVGEQVSGGAGWAIKNSGVMFHAQAPETMLLDQEFPVSIEAQFLGGLGDGERPTGNLCTPGTNVVIPPAEIGTHDAPAMPTFPVTGSTATME